MGMVILWRQKQPLEAIRPAFYSKKTPLQVFSCETCGIFKNTYFEEYLRTTACMASAQVKLSSKQVVHITVVVGITDICISWQYLKFLEFTLMNLQTPWGEACYYPTGNYMFKANNRNAIGIVLVSTLLTLNIFHTLI